MLRLAGFGDGAVMFASPCGPRSWWCIALPVAADRFRNVDFGNKLPAPWNRDFPHDVRTTNSSTSPNYVEAKILCASAQRGRNFSRVGGRAAMNAKSNQRDLIFRQFATRRQA